MSVWSAEKVLKIFHSGGDCKQITVIFFLTVNIYLLLRQVVLCDPGWPSTQYVEQTGHKLALCHVLGLRMYALA